MKAKKIISCVMAFALVVTQFTGTMAFASDGSETPESSHAILAPTEKAMEEPSDTKVAPTEENSEKMNEAVKAVVDLFAVVPDGITAIAEGQEGYEGYKSAVDAAISAMNAISALGVDDKIVAEATIGDRVSYVNSLIPTVTVPNAVPNEESKIETEKLIEETPSVMAMAAPASTATTGEAVRDYELLGGVTVRFEGAVGDYSIALEANDVARTYGDKYVPNGLTMTVKGLTAVEQAAFDYKTVFDNPTTPETDDLIPLTFNVVGGTEQSNKTTAGTYSVGVGCGANAVNYAGHSFAVNSTNKGNITVSCRPITIIAQDANKTYGQSDPSFNYTVKSGMLVNGDVLYVNGAGQGLYRDHNGSVTEQVGSYPIKSNLINSNYNITFEDTGRLKIAKASLIITGGFTDELGVFKQTNTREYGDKDLAFGFNASGLQRGDNLADFGTVSVDFKATSTSVPGDYYVTPYGLGATLSNYDVTYTNGTLHVAPRTIQITVDDSSKVYGDEDYILSYEILAPNAATPKKPATSWDGKALVSLKGDVTRLPGENAGKYSIVNGYTDEKNPNYKILFTANDFVIKQAPLNITVQDVKRFYGDDNPEFTVVYEGFKKGETPEANSLTGKLVINCLADKTSDVNTYAINASGYDTDGNYDIKYNAGILTVAARPMIVTIDNKTSVYGDIIKELTYSLSKNSLVGEDKFTGKIGFKPGVDVKNVGIYEIVINFDAPMKNYDISISKGEYEITPATIKVTMADSSKYYGAKTMLPNMSYEGFKNGDEQFLNVMAVALLTQNSSILPNVTIKVTDEVAGIKGYVADDVNAKAVFNDAFKFAGETFGNYKYEMASGNLSVSRLQSTEDMYSVNGSKKSEDTYGSNVAIVAANGYKLSYSDALEGNAWSDSLQIYGDAAHNVKFYVVRLSDGAITNSSVKTIKIDTYVAPAANPAPTYTVVNNPRTGADFLLQNIWLIISLAVISATAILYRVIKKRKTTKIHPKDNAEVIDVKGSEVSEVLDAADESDNTGDKS